jgi:hypothetical protein
MLLIVDTFDVDWLTNKEFIVTEPHKFNVDTQRS